MPSTQTDRLRGLTTSVAVKAPVLCASTGNISSLNSTQTVDGVNPSTGDRVLVKNQTSSTANGIYEVRSSDWQRTADFDGQRDAVWGSIVYVTTGAMNGDTWWRVSSTGINVPGSSDIDFSRITAFGTVDDGLSGFIEVPSNKTYTLSLNSPRAFDITTLHGILSSGACTAAVQLNSTNVTGLGSISLSTVETTATATAVNSVSSGDTVDLVITNSSSPRDLAFTVATQLT